MTDATEELPLALVGCDFRTASSRWRSHLVLDERESAVLYHQLVDGAGADGFFALSTCNRNEWVVSSDQPQWAAELLRARMQQRLDAAGENRIAPYALVGEAAAEHIFRVALGQESLVTGERQIARQLFKALETAREGATSSRALNGLGTIAGRLVARANRCGCLASMTRGVHALALSAIRRRREPGAEPTRVAVIGLGFIGRRAQALVDVADDMIAIPCNRTPREGVRPLTELPTILAEVDAAILCSQAPEPLIDRAALSQRTADRPLIAIDLGIPEQISRDLGEGGVRIGLDELTEEVAGDGQSIRAREQAEDLARNGVEQFRRLCHEPELLGVIEAVQRCTELLLDDRLPELVQANYAHLSPEDREQLAGDLRRLLSKYTHDLYGAIRETADGPACDCEAPPAAELEN